jgi:uncharacterized protein YecT (DUF1311 family)
MHRLLLFLTVAFLWSWGVEAAAQTRDYCRNKADEQDMVRCIENGIYDPCDDSSASGSGWWTAQCAWAHLAIAEKKMKAIEKEILTRLRKTDTKQDAGTALALVQQHWRNARDTYCEFANAVRDADGFDGEVLGFCLRRLTEGRVKELQGLLSREE